MSSGASSGATASISEHGKPADAKLRLGFGPRVRKLHARIGKAHHHAEGMAFSRALLDGKATALQLASLLRALAPAYSFLEENAPGLAYALGAEMIPWSDLARSKALQHDISMLTSLPVTPVSVAAGAWQEQLKLLARQAPHRLMAHVYVRYGGDLSGGQQLGSQANTILQSHGFSSLHFWMFDRPVQELKQGLHDGFEQLKLTDQEETELLEEADVAFQATQRLLAELEQL
ncbi:MAG: biliverdin-producing heme oxygenase [Prochlorococcus sp.]